MQQSDLVKLIESLPGAVYQYRQWKDGRCKFSYCTGTIEKILFAEPDELATDGLLAWQFVCPEFAESVREGYLRAAETSSDVEMTFSVRSPQGNLSWVRNRAVLVSQDDKCSVWNGCLDDVTAEIVTEETTRREIEQTAAFIQSAFDNLDDQLYYKDIQSRCLGGNAAWVKSRGADSLEELIGKTDLDLHPAPLGQELYEAEQRLIASGQVERKLERYELDDGSVQYLESVKSPMLNAAGETIGLAGISRDVTHQVENEQKAAFIQAAFDNLDDQLYYKDVQSRCLGGNAAWIKSRGAGSLEELIGKTDLDLHPAPLGQEFYEAEQRLIASGQVERTRERYELDDGTVQYLESVKSPMLNAAGETIGLAGISRDITKQVENELFLVEARKAADSANQAKSMFLAMMSHEIRTPMNGIIGAASLLSGTELAPMQKEFVRTINVSGENLLTLINDILDYSKIEAGKIKLENTSFSLRACIEDCFDIFGRAAGKKNLELLHYVDPDIPRVLLGDPTRLRQVIINLVGNAVKFTGKGEVSLKVVSVDGDVGAGRCRIRFAISDTGIGIAEEAKENLFKAFTQADDSSTRKYGGTGLGLTISLRLVELMGGQISLESKLEEGSTFYFELELPVSSETLEQNERPNVAETLSGKRALIIDDNETNRWLLGDQLASWEMPYKTFELPEEALLHLQQGHEYDIVLTDYHMPVMTGRALAEAIHALPSEKPLPVIILSSSYETFPNDPYIHAWLSKPVKQVSLRNQLLQVFSGEDPAAESPSTRIQARKTYDLRVLVAEDNSVNQRIIKMMLDRLGYECSVVVPDGEDAVAAMIDNEYDLILMDVQMPGMNGLLATREIRKLSGDPEKPWIIALTAGVMEEERKAAMEAGMNGFLAKPLAVDHLEKVLDKIRK